MQEKDIIKKLKAEADKLTVPEVFDKIIEDKDFGDVPQEQSKKNRKPFYLKITAAAAVIIILAVSFGFMFNSLMFDKTVYAKISIDINPSIEISVNKDYKVVDIVCINDAANDIVITKMQRRKHIGAVVKNIIKNAINQKYIRESSDNAVLISIAGADDVFYNNLKQIISDNINSACTGIRLNQIFEEYSHELKTQAHEYGISVGKLKRIKYAYSLNSNGLTEVEFIKYMKTRSIMYIQKYIDDNQ